MIRDSFHNLNGRKNQEDHLNTLLMIGIFAEIIYKFALFQYEDTRLINSSKCQAN